MIFKYRNRGCDYMTKEYENNKQVEIDDNFIMSPKYDFVFKYIFGNEKHKELLIALLSDILTLPEEEIPKLFDEDIERDENDPIVQWMEFLDAESKGEMEVLAEKNNDIKMAYNLLKVISKDEKARMLYEAKYAEISDQRTRIKSAEEKGAIEKALKVAENLLLMGINIEQIASATELPMEKVIELKKKYEN